MAFLFTIEEFSPKELLIYLQNGDGNTSSKAPDFAIVSPHRLLLFTTITHQLYLFPTPFRAFAFSPS